MWDRCEEDATEAAFPAEISFPLVLVCDEDAI
jgi:hypothetical protein